MANKQSKGRGWFGNSEGHRVAGRKGGKARARNMKKNKKMAKRDDIHTSLLDEDNF